MLRKFYVLALAGLLLISSCGCIALLAGAVGGAGTAVWLSGKLTQEFNTPYDRTINAAKSALKALKLQIAKETRDENVAQIKSNYYDGKEIWIDIKKVTDYSSKVEVRVGAVSPDKEAASKILNKIRRYL